MLFNQTFVNNILGLLINIMTYMNDSLNNFQINNKKIKPHYLNYFAL